MQRSQRFHVRVPASTSNLGPGFDFLGLAVGLFLEATVTIASGSAAGTRTVTYGTLDGNDPIEPAWDPQGDLVLRSLAGYEAHVGRVLPGLAVHVQSEIPVGRGFGSSGAAVAASLLLAAAVDQATHGRAATPDMLTAWALEIEGHPDNGTASLLGGCTAAVPTPEDPDHPMAIVQPEVNEALAVALAWPETPLFTDEARAALPTSFSLAEATENPRRLALLLEGLRTAHPRWLRLGVVDQLHERYRRALVPGSQEAIEAACAAGAYTGCLSGAGSGVVALGPRDRMESVAAAMAACLKGGVGRAVEVVRTVAAVEATTSK